MHQADALDQHYSLRMKHSRVGKKVSIHRDTHRQAMMWKEVHVSHFRVTEPGQQIRDGMRHECRHQEVLAPEVETSVHQARYVHCLELQNEQSGSQHARFPCSCILYISSTSGNTVGQGWFDLMHVICRSGSYTGHCCIGTLCYALLCSFLSYGGREAVGWWHGLHA